MSLLRSASALVATVLALGSAACEHDSGQGRAIDARTDAALSPCAFGNVDVHDWVGHPSGLAAVTVALPPGARRLATRESVASESWEFAAGSVSLELKDWGASWRDSVASDFSSAQRLCAESVNGAQMSVRAFYGDPHPFDEGQYLIAYRALKDGQVLVLRAFARDSAARDTLFAIAKGIRVPE